MSEACRFDGGACLTHSTNFATKLATKDICDLGLAALRRQLDDQARVMAGLREALEDGVRRHRELDRWTFMRVEEDPGAYIHVIRKALSPTEPTPKHIPNLMLSQRMREQFEADTTLTEPTEA